MWWWSLWDEWGVGGDDDERVLVGMLRVVG